MWERQWHGNGRGQKERKVPRSKCSTQGSAACGGQKGDLRGLTLLQETIPDRFRQRRAGFLLLGESVPGALGRDHLPGVGEVSISSLFMCFIPRVG